MYRLRRSSGLLMRVEYETIEEAEKGAEKLAKRLTGYKLEIVCQFFPITIIKLTEVKIVGW